MFRFCNEIQWRSRRIALHKGLVFLFNVILLSFVQNTIKYTFFYKFFNFYKNFNDGKITAAPSEQSTIIDLSRKVFPILATLKKSQVKRLEWPVDTCTKFE